ncbi:MAG: hypothetical protein VX683_05870, partial [Cyanobacteriota bacterium]|nr:hypothetical protein [Cyanobacteriota bacterium]
FIARFGAVNHAAEQKSMGPEPSGLGWTKSAPETKFHACSQVAIKGCIFFGGCFTKHNGICHSKWHYGQYCEAKCSPCGHLVNDVARCLQFITRAPPNLTPLAVANPSVPWFQRKNYWKLKT